jgi:hypothetical protein
MILGDFKTEDDRLTLALELAFNEISKEKEEENDSATIADKEMNKNARKKNYLGTHAMIKLPYVIGTPEYYKHLYAGIVYLGNLGDEFEQVDLHNEE